MEPIEPELIELTVRLPRELAEAVILGVAPSARGPEQRRLALAKWLLTSRRRRAKAFQGVRFGEPNWDMILDLYIAEREGRRVDVSGMCLASGVAPTTALRYVDLLVADALIGKVADLEDGRRSFVTISNRLRSSIEDWLDQAEVALGVAGWNAPSDPMSDQAGEADRARSR